MKRRGYEFLLIVAVCGCEVGVKDERSEASAASTLEALDARTPVPLLPMMANHRKENMRDHLVAVQEVVMALASDDFAAAERAAQRIGYSEQTGHMCNHMGKGAPGFTEQALRFHHAADRIGAAAREGDRTEVLKELGTTLQACTACHASWKQQVVDEASWQRIVASPRTKNSSAQARLAGALISKSRICPMSPRPEASKSDA